MKKFLKKGDGLATVVITIVLVVIALLVVPALKAYQANSSSGLETEATTQGTIINEAMSISSGDAGYSQIS